MADDQIKELQQLLVDRDQRIAALETRLDEQEQSIRHILTMLIEWMEAEGYQKVA